MIKGGNQRWPEFHAWASLCLGLGVRTYLELGCGSAGYMRLAGVKSVAVDLLEDNHGGCIDHFHANSHDPGTVDRVLGVLGGSPDAVFIDADHEYGAVRADFNLWWPIAGIVVGFHDLLMPGPGALWREISLRHPSIELIARDSASAEEWQKGLHCPDGKLSCGGIGVLFKERLP